MAAAPAHRSRRRRAALAAFALLVLAAGCAAPAPRQPQAVLVNGSDAPLSDISFVGEQGLAAPRVERLAPGDSTRVTLDVGAEDAVFVSFIARGRACVSDDSAYVERGKPYEVRLVVDSTLGVRVAAVTFRH